MPTRRFNVLLVLVPLLIVLPSANAASVQVYLHDNPFHLQITPALLNAAGTATFNVTNTGSVTHDFTLCRRAEDGGCARPLAFTPLLKPGQSVAIQADLTPGDYEVRCTVPGHADGGMRATLSVGASSQGTPGLGGLPFVLALVALTGWRRWHA